MKIFTFGGSMRPFIKSRKILKVREQKAVSSKPACRTGRQEKDVPYSGGLQATATYVAEVSKIPRHEKSIPNCSAPFRVRIRKQKEEGRKQIAVSKGDVVLYKKGDCYFVHRIVKKLDKGWIVEDDAGVVGRHFIERDEVIGKVELPWYISGRTGFYISEILRYFFKIGREFKNFLKKKEEE